MSRVFVVQDTMRRDQNGQLTRVFDLTPAAQYGTLTFILSNEKLPRDLSGLIPEWRAKLEDFCDDDFLVCIGDPIAIGISTTFASNANDGRVRFLRWVPKRQTYEEIAVDIWHGYEDVEEDCAISY